MDFKILKKTPVFQSFSTFGRMIFQPNGIFYWLNRAKKEAQINATIGTAKGLENDIIENGRNKKITYFLPQIKNYIKMDPDKLVPYASIAGVPEFRELWKRWIVFKGNRDGKISSNNRDFLKKITKPIICNGITNGIFLISQMFLDPGETIICPNKRWGNYNSVLKRKNGLKIESFQFFKENKFNIDGMIKSMENIAEKQEKIVLLLNFPNNPTGYCPKYSEIEEIIKYLKNFCDEFNLPLIVLCDDAYEGYIFSEDVIANSIFYKLVDIHPKIIPIKLDGASKEMMMYGARIGAITLGIHDSWVDTKFRQEFENQWNNKLKGAIRATISNTNRFNQEILKDMMKNGFKKIIEERKKIIKILKDRHDASISAFKKYSTPNITIDPSGGGFFVFLNIEGIPADEFADFLLKKYQVGTFPIRNPEEKINGLRVAFCSVTLENIDECFKSIDKAMRNFKT